MKKLLPVVFLLASCGAESFEVAEAEVRTFRHVGWTTVHGRRVRALTSDEQRRLGRPASSYVVEDQAALDAMALGAQQLQLLVPSSARTGDLFIVRRTSTQQSPFPFLLRDGRGGGNALVDSYHPTFHEYLTDDGALRSRTGGVVKLVAEAGKPNSMSARGALGATSVEVGVVRPALLDPGLATGPAIVFSYVALGQPAQDAQTQCNTSGICDAFCYNANANSVCDPDVWDHGCCQPWGGAGPGVEYDECSDGIDNDGDGNTDFSDTACGHSDFCGAPGMPLHAHRHESGADIALLGEIALCTELGDQWTTGFWGRAAAMKQIFHSSSGAPLTGSADFDNWVGFPTNAKPIRIAAVGCWVLDDLTHAQQCRTSGGAACAPFTAGSSHPYPYAGSDDSVFSYVANVKNDILHGVNEAGLDTPLHAAHVTVGLSVFSTASGLAESAPGFASAGVWPGYEAVMAHEIGHTLGLEHCTTSIVHTYAGGSNKWSLMGDDEADFCAVPDGDQESHQLGAIEAGTLYENLREVIAEVDGQDHWFIHPPSFGNH